MTASVLQLALWALASLHFSNAHVDKSPRTYTPKTNQQCPKTLLRRTPASKQTLNRNEAHYVADRRRYFPDAWRDWVGDGSDLGYDLDELGITADHGSGLPAIGIAMSGGGHRCVPMAGRR